MLLSSSQSKIPVYVIYYINYKYFEISLNNVTITKCFLNIILSQQNTKIKQKTMMDQNSIMEVSITKLFDA